jgi:hypothetical protein
VQLARISLRSRIPQSSASCRSGATKALGQISYSGGTRDRQRQAALEFPTTKLWTERFSGRGETRVSSSATPTGAQDSEDQRVILGQGSLARVAVLQESMRTGEVTTEHGHRDSKPRERNKEDGNRFGGSRVPPSHHRVKPEKQSNWLQR